MGPLVNKIVGLKKSDFDSAVNVKDGIKLRSAKLISTYKPGDEMVLTSIFLSGLRLIKEFKNDFFSEIKMMKGGQIYVYTEVTFPQDEKSRIDGLILIVKGGVIKDAAILEMKNKNNAINQEQILRYMQVAKQLSIPKLVTISNEFVSEPTQSPLNVRVPKKVDLYHFSWSYIITLAHILLFKNDNNIEDEDQVEVMKEIVGYFENSISGVVGFTQMKPGWKDVVEKINAGSSLKLSDQCISETVSSWQQEEKDMALILSRKLGLLVKSGDARFRNDLKARIKNDSKKLIDKKRLVSTLKIKGAVSDITVRALFDKRIIEMAIKLNVPKDRGTKAQIGWLKRQIDNCQKKDTVSNNEILNELKIDINVKHARNDERISFDRLEEMYEELKNKEINGFGVVQVKDFGKSFASRQKFVQTIENMLVVFYKGLVQHLVRWEQSAPKIVEEFKNNSEKEYQPETPKVKPKEIDPLIECPTCKKSAGFSRFNLDKDDIGTCPNCDISLEFE